jgi:hypothetical protein
MPGTAIIVLCSVIQLTQVVENSMLNGWSGWPVLAEPISIPPFFGITLLVSLVTIYIFVTLQDCSAEFLQLILGMLLPRAIGQRAIGPEGQGPKGKEPEGPLKGPEGPEGPLKGPEGQRARAPSVSLKGASQL